MRADSRRRVRRVVGRYYGATLLPNSVRRAALQDSFVAVTLRPSAERWNLTSDVDRHRIAATLVIARRPSTRSEDRKATPTPERYGAAFKMRIRKHRTSSQDFPTRMRRGRCAAPPCANRHTGLLFICVLLSLALCFGAYPNSQCPELIMTLSITFVWTIRA